MAERVRLIGVGGAALLALVACGLTARAGDKNKTPPGFGRIAAAVGGVESSHGADPRMWRADPDGPQGPMQVTAAAAADVGGGDRFDLDDNRRLGRAYLARLYRDFGNWPDALAAYNWGPGNMAAWVEGGRRPASLPREVVRYQLRVIFGTVLGSARRARGRRLGIVHRQPRAAGRHRHRHHRFGHGTLSALYAEAMRASTPGGR